MKVKALEPWSNGEISMEQYEVRDLPDALAQNLIDAGIVVEIGGGGLPPVTASDAGKVLSVNNSGVWGAQEPIGKKFIVTLTPTEADYSGTMDKTVAEINAAYEAGQQIVYRFMLSGSAYGDLATTVDYVGNHPYPEHFAMGVLYEVGIIVISANTDEAESTVYYTKVYPLTPAT